MPPSYKAMPLAIREESALSISTTFQQTDAIDVTPYRSALLRVQYTQGTATGDNVYPLVRMAGGSDNNKADFGYVQIEDASNPTDLGFGIGLVTDMRTSIKALRDAADQIIDYPVDLTKYKFVAFDFAEFGGDPGDPGVLAAWLIVEVDH